MFGLFSSNKINQIQFEPEIDINLIKTGNIETDYISIRSMTGDKLNIIRNIKTQASPISGISLVIEGFEKYAIEPVAEDIKFLNGSAFLEITKEDEQKEKLLLSEYKIAVQGSPIPKKQIEILKKTSSFVPNFEWMPVDEAKQEVKSILLEEFGYALNDYLTDTQSGTKPSKPSTKKISLNTDKLINVISITIIAVALIVFAGGKLYKSFVNTEVKSDQTILEKVNPNTIIQEAQQGIQTQPVEDEVNLQKSINDETDEEFGFEKAVTLEN